MEKIFTKSCCRRWVALVMLASFLGSPVASWACTSIIVGKDASTTGKVLIARTADANPTLSARFIIHEAGRFKEGVKYTLDPTNGFEFTFSHDSYRYTAVPMTTISYRNFIAGTSMPLDEVAKYYESFEQSGVNEKGLTVSATNTTGFRAGISNFNYQTGEATGIDPAGKWMEQTMTTVLLAECATAQEALKVMGEIVETQGMDNSLLMFADKDEAWIAEALGGSRWVATRVPDDCFAVIANATVTDRLPDNPEHYRISADYQEFAEGANSEDLNIAVYHSDGKLNIARTFGRMLPDDGTPNTIRDVNGSYNSYRRWRGYDMFAPSLKLKPLVNADMDVYKLYVKPDQKISPTDVMNFQRDRYNGVENVPGVKDLEYSPQYLNPDTGREINEANTGLEIRSIGYYNQLFTHVFEAGWGELSIGARFWISMGAAESSVNIPFYGNITDTHPFYRKDIKLAEDNVYQPDSAFWLFADTGILARSNRRQYAKPIKDYWRAYELKMYDDLAAVETEMMKLHATDPKAAARLITDYTLQVSERTFKKAEEIHDALAEHIKLRSGDLFVVPADTNIKESGGGCNAGTGVFALLFIACLAASVRNRKGKNRI
jgi:dipeptidase